LALALALGLGLGVTNLVRVSVYTFRRLFEG
jgi:hypothetical protein